MISYIILMISFIIPMISYVILIISYMILMISPLYFSYDKDKQRVPPPRGFSAPAPWKVPPPRGIPDECPRLVAYIWRGHFG